MGWRIFSVFCIILWILAVGRFINDGFPDLLEIAGFLFATVANVGLFGLGFRERIFSRGFWITFAWVFGIWSIAILTIGFERTLPAIESAQSRWVLAGVWFGFGQAALMLVLMWLAIWRYPQKVTLPE